MRRAKGTRLANVPAAARGRFGVGRPAGSGAPETGVGWADDGPVETGRLVEMGEVGMRIVSERSNANAIRVGRGAGTL